MTAPFTSDDELAAIAAGVMDLSLPKPCWTHRAHFAAALWLLARRPDLDLPRVMPGLIRAYNEATGVANTDTDGYHETITQAWMRLLASHDERDFAEFLTLHGDRVSLDLLHRYWRRETLMSDTARARWVEPDLTPLPPPIAREHCSS